MQAKIQTDTILLGSIHIQQFCIRPLPEATTKLSNCLSSAAQSWTLKILFGKPRPPAGQGTKAGQRLRTTFVPRKLPVVIKNGTAFSRRTGEVTLPEVSSRCWLVPGWLTVEQTRPARSRRTAQRLR